MQHREVRIGKHFSKRVLGGKLVHSKKKKKKKTTNKKTMIVSMKK